MNIFKKKYNNNNIEKNNIKILIINISCTFRKSCSYISIQKVIVNSTMK